MTPTAPLTTAADLQAARDFIQAVRCPTFVDDDGWFPIRPTELAAFLTTYAAQVRRAQWQDIATAPKDGTELLLFNGFRFIGRYFTPQFQTGGWWVSNAMPVTPTHWQPLPSPPGSPSSQTDTGDAG